MDSTQLTLKLIIVIHFILSIWASMVCLPTSYIYMNIFIFAFSMWAIICPESFEAIQMFLIMMIISIPMEIIFLGIFATEGSNIYNYKTASSNLINAYRFSLGMAILNLLLKPISCFLLYRICQHRLGEFQFPNFAQSIGQKGYSTIGNGGGFGSTHSRTESASPYSTLERPRSVSSTQLIIE